MSLMNRLGNSSNPLQGLYKRVLCVCSAGLLRSPTAAAVLSQEPYNFNTRAAGLVTEFALIPVDEVLLQWAEEVVCMTTTQQAELKHKVRKGCKLICLDIPDSFSYRQPELMELIRQKYDETIGKPKAKRKKKKDKA